MNRTSFVMQTDVGAVVPGSLDFNYDELKQWLSANLEEYRLLVVSEDGIAEAKADRARINKIAKAISAQRIAVKKQYMQPFADFEAKCKELESLCGEASSALDVQIKRFDERDKVEKKAVLEAVFETEAHDILDCLDFDDIFEPRWLNKTVSREKAAEQIRNKVAACRSDIRSIREMDSQFAAELLDLYRKRLSLAACMERERELAAIHRREQAREQAEDEQPVEIEDAVELRVVEFRCWVTREQMLALKAFLKENGIRYGKV